MGAVFLHFFWPPYRRWLRYWQRAKIILLGIIGICRLAIILTLKASQQLHALMTEVSAGLSRSSTRNGPVPGIGRCLPSINNSTLRLAQRRDHVKISSAVL